MYTFFSIKAVDSVSNLIKYKLDYNLQILLYFILMLPYLEPQIFKILGYETIDKLYALTKFLSAIIIILIYFFTRKCRISLFVTIQILLQVWILLSTVINAGSLTRFAGPAITSVVIVMLGELVSKKNWINFMIILRDFLFSLLIMNFALQLYNLIILNEYDLTTFLGINNRWFYFYLPIVFISMMVSQVKYNKIDIISKIIFAITFLSLLLAQSVGAVLAMLAFIVVFMFFKYSLFNFVNQYIAFCIINFFLVKGYILDFFTFIISDYLYKDITLSGRTYLWDTVMQILEESPFLGMGVQSIDFDCEYFFAQSGYVIGCFVNHPHNHFLNIGYHGGIVAMFLLFLSYFLVMKYADGIKDLKIKQIAISSFAAFFVAGLVDTLDFSLFYLFIPIITHMLNNDSYNNFRSV